MTSEIKRKKIIVSYNGQFINGWHGDNNTDGIFVQECIQEAIYNISQQKVIVYCAGRTDSGVHAIHQVCHFDIMSDVDNKKLVYGINHYLPSFIQIMNMNDVNNQFHARFSAKLRHYQYYIYDGNILPPMLQNHTSLTKYNNITWKDIYQAIEEIKRFPNMRCFCLPSFIGKKDRSLSSISMTKESVFGYDVHVLSVSAKSFSHHQIRIIIGALIDVGRGQISQEKFIEYGMKSIEGPYTVWSPRGLYLSDVTY